MLYKEGIILDWGEADEEILKNADLKYGKEPAVGKILLDEERFMLVAKYILKKHRPAFEELAKGN